jgi:hypothetical protein
MQGYPRRTGGNLCLNLQKLSVCLLCGGQERIPLAGDGVLDGAIQIRGDSMSYVISHVYSPGLGLRVL